MNALKMKYTLLEDKNIRQFLDIEALKYTATR